MLYLIACMRVIVRHPCSRSRYVLYSVSLLLCPPKLVDMFAQTFYDAEARVTGYVSGKGRLAGITGALKCEMESGKKFNVGTGLSDKQRKNPPKIGSIITYRFQELTRDGVPRLYSPFRLYMRDDDADIIFSFLQVPFVYWRANR